MIKRTYTYTDYDGNERTEDYYFNLTNAEVLKLELTTTGGMTQKINRLISSRNVPEIVKVFDEIVDLAYGIKSPDGREFMKSEEICRSFKQTEGYSKLFMDFMSKEGFAAEFFNELLPNTASEDGSNVVVIDQR